MKNTQSGFISIAVGIIIVLALIGGGTYVYLENKEPTPLEQETNIVSTETPKIVETQAPIKQTTKPETVVSTESVGKCGLNISNLLPNEKVTWPLIIKGTVDMKSSGDCTWQTFEGVAGTAQFYIYLTEENRDGKMKGWTSIGDSVIMNLEKVTAEKANFTVTFNFTEGGFQMNAPIKIVFTEENPAVIRPSLTLELPLVLK